MTANLNIKGDVQRRPSLEWSRGDIEAPTGYES